MDAAGEISQVAGMPGHPAGLAGAALTTAQCIQGLPVLCQGHLYADRASRTLPLANKRSSRAEYPPLSPAPLSLHAAACPIGAARRLRLFIRRIDRLGAPLSGPHFPSRLAVSRA